MTYVGDGEAQGMNVNIPWSCGAKTDADYMYAFQQVVMPIAYEFNPDFVFSKL
jgi:histone deacetylase 6